MAAAVLADDEEPSLNLGAGGLKIGKGGVPAKYAGLIQEAAEDCDAGLSAAVLAAQIQQESGFNPRADSGQAQGIAQFIPTTWASSGIDGNGDGKKDVWDPEDAIPSQGRMMCKLLKTAKKHPEYNGSPIELALAAYNAGWHRVEQYRGVPPERFAAGQTYHYVEIIMAGVKRFSDEGGTSSSGWTRPVKGPLGTPYHARGGAWSSGQHTGIDFVVPTGTTVRAVGSGTVVAAGPGGAYGNQVVIRHADGHYSQYGHMSKVHIVKGDKVKSGQKIGISGATGNASGPHLHFEIRTGPDYGSDIDPAAFLRNRGVKL
ncbi:peptidoglycan DD-metalloendopeptidase family protein [Streptomyces spirodelae]|uniref:Peptidoglycan DD-metalloendopeptidase family protein n=1 Tax=Streptomyces spirodelae TaxID=2812904 RepID=A0ABS3X3D5_9ACTN|nr:peptidoglycan DD-metalloendopeptidase family protein [Streptomyces spirodelae]MBO8189887.1 peptidoglycan DD-metalloendopeptidase family protein [Streptomyces spirodelae]